MGHAIRVETQGSVGAQDQLTEEEIADADMVVLACDIDVDPCAVRRQAHLPHLDRQRAEEAPPHP